MNDIKAFVGYGALAGVAGGVAAAVFQWTVTERQIRHALAIESAKSTSAHTEMFSRGTQVIGGMVGALLYGIFIGLIFAIACAALWRRLPGRSAFSRSIKAASAIFVAWALVPALKYPANPPGVGNADTIGQRTTAYLGLMILSILLLFLAWELWTRLTARGVDGAARFASVAASYLVVIGAAYLIFPSNPDAVDVPATLVWHFRLDSLAGNALLWFVMGTTFGWLGDRATTRASRPVVDDERVEVLP